MPINAQGWLDRAAQVCSPHYNERPLLTDVDLIVIHNISLPLGKFGTGYVASLFEGTLDCQADPSFVELEGLQVSSHFFISRTGTLEQYVSCNKRAWHAGVSCFNGRENCNDFSIGIELEGSDFVPFEPVQYLVLAKLIEDIAKAYPIKAVAGHSHIAPTRKTDPGPFFDWLRLVHLCEFATFISFPFVD